MTARSHSRIRKRCTGKQWLNKRAGRHKVRAKSRRGQ